MVLRDEGIVCGILDCDSA